MDYRYFPEPDLLPVVLEDDLIESLRAELPELPIEKRLKYLSEYKLGDDDARLLTSDKPLSDYFDTMVSLTNDPKKSCSYITSTLLGLIKESEEIDEIEQLKFAPEELAEVIKLVNNDELSSTNSKLVIDELFANG